MAPSPSVFLAAVSQRSERLRFGPLLYVTPMYHPLRVAEEVVMLDHLSRGRLELGLGRGASPVEIATFNIDPENAPAMNREATELVLKALTSDVLSFEGKFYRCNNVRIAERPLQRPYPPLWFAPIEPSRAADAAKLKGNMVTLIPNAGVKACVDAYRSTWLALGHKETEMPLVGVFRHVVVADSDEKHAPRPATRIGRGGTIWRSCGIGAAYPFRLVRSIRTTSRRSKRPIWVSPARRKPCGVTSPTRSHRPALHISPVTWPSARFPTISQRAPSTCSSRTLCRRSDDVAKCHVEQTRGGVEGIGIQFQVPEQQQR